MSSIVCPSIVVSDLSSSLCVVKTGSCDDKESTDREMSRPTIFCRWTAFRGIANGNDRDSTDSGQPVMEKTLCHERSFLAYQVPLNLSIHKGLQAHVLESFTHRRIFSPYSLQRSRLRATMERVSHHLRKGARAAITMSRRTSKSLCPQPSPARSVASRAC